MRVGGCVGELHDDDGVAHDNFDCEVEGHALINQEVTVVVRCAVCIANERFSTLDVDEGLREGSRLWLREGREVKDVLSLGNHIVESEVWPRPYKYAIGDLVLSGRNDYHIPDVLQVCSIILREIIQFCVEEDIVEPDISEEDDCPVFAGGPPRSKTKE